MRIMGGLGGGMGCEEFWYGGEFWGGVITCVIFMRRLHTVRVDKRGELNADTTWLDCL